MKKKTIYSNAPKDIGNAIKESKIIEDFLPTPEELVKKEENIKITITLSKESVSFFKKKAKNIGVPYQTMIKNLLDKYTEKYNQ